MKKVKHGVHGMLKTMCCSCTRCAFFFILSILLPSNGKRILVLTSLHAQLVQRGVFQAETLHKLNQTLCLARSDEALNLPTAVSGRLWDSSQLDLIIRDIHTKDTGSVCLPYQEAKRVSESIVAILPSWLRYDDNEHMVRDTINLFYC